MLYARAISFGNSKLNLTHFYISSIPVGHDG